MSALVEFLLARIAEDEENGGRYVSLFPTGDLAAVFRRVLAECEAKRRIVELRDSWADQVDVGGIAGDFARVQTSAADAILRALAAVYTGHPDYREEWRP